MNKIEIQDAIKKDKIVLFMKGTRNFPQCGFSGRMIDILGQFNVEYVAVGVPGVNKQQSLYAKV